jgi:hypothetical protein
VSTISTTVSKGIVLGTIASGGTYSSPLTITSTGAVRMASSGSTQSAIAGPGTSAWTVQNQGTVLNSAGVGNGISLAAGGYVGNNASSALIQGYDGVYITGAAGTVVNSGTIAGSLVTGKFSYGVRLDNGGTVTNSGSILAAQTGYAIRFIFGYGYLTNNSGGYLGTGGVLLASGGTVVNSGRIVSVGGPGLKFGASGVTANSVVNTGTISASGASGVGVVMVGQNTLVNSGSISGATTAVYFGGVGYSSRLILEHGYKITGSVVAGAATNATVELAGSVGNNVTASFNGLVLTNFSDVLFGPSGHNTLKVSNVAGTLGPVISGFSLTNGTIDLTAIGTNGTITQNDTVNHRVTVSGTGGTVTFKLDTTDRTNFLVKSDGASGTVITLSLQPVTDYNHDGLGDLLLRNERGGRLYFLPGSSTGSFSGTLVPATGGLPNLRPAGHGDINGDGIADVVVQDPASRLMYAGLEDGSGSGQPTWQLTPPVLGWTAKGVGDINGDGYADIVIQNDNTFAVQYYDVHNAAFVAAANPGYNVVGVGDVNGDGYADIVAQNPANGQILYLNMSGGVYSGTVNLVQTPGWDVRAVGDINGDGYADIVIENSAGQTMFANTKGGVLTGWGTPTTGLSPDLLIKDAVDLNGDNYADVIVEQLSTGQLFYAIEGASGFDHWVIVTSGLGARSQVVGNNPTLPPRDALASDYTGTGTGDVLFRDDSTGQLMYGIMSAGTLTGFGFATGQLAGFSYGGHGDINGDGIADVVVQDTTTRQLYAALEDGSGNGTPNWQLEPAVPGWTAKQVGDINGDGYADIVIQNDTSNAVDYYDVHNATFITLPTVANAAVVGVGDVNGDGADDVVLQDPTSAEIYYLSATAGMVDVGNPGTGFQVRAVGDLTGIGFADIAVQDNAGNTKYLNMQGGTLQGYGMATTGLSSDFQITGAVDVFNNGHADLIVRQFSTGITHYAAQGSNGFDHWGIVTGSLGGSWHAV